MNLGMRKHGARGEPAVRRMLQTSRQEVLDYVEFLLSKVSIDAERAAETGPARVRTSLFGISRVDEAEGDNPPTGSRAGIKVAYR